MRRVIFHPEPQAFALRDLHRAANLASCVINVIKVLSLPRHLYKLIDFLRFAICTSFLLSDATVGLDPDGAEAAPVLARPPGFDRALLDDEAEVVGLAELEVAAHRGHQVEAARRPRRELECLDALVEQDHVHLRRRRHGRGHPSVASRGSSRLTEGEGRSCRPLFPLLGVAFRAEGA